MDHKCFCFIAIMHVEFWGNYSSFKLFFKLAKKIEKESIIKTLYFTANFHSKRLPSQNNQKRSIYFNVLEPMNSREAIS